MREMHKTVFVAYRATVCQYIARAIFHDLWEYGYELFIEPESTPAENLSLRQVEARAHFLLIMTPGTVVQCRHENDWLRRLVEHAIDLKRNIISLLVDGFRFEEYPVCVTGKMRQLARSTLLPFNRDRWQTDVRVLRTRLLNRPVEVDVTPTSAADRVIVHKKTSQVLSQTPPLLAEVLAESYVERALQRQATDYQGQIRDYDQAISLNPHYALAYRSRARLHEMVGNLQGAQDDYDVLVALLPKDINVYLRRAAVRRSGGDWEGALSDLNVVLEMDRHHIQAYNHRGLVHEALKDFDAAIADFTRAIELEPAQPNTYYYRATTYQACGDWQSAVEDYRHYLACSAAYQVGHRIDVEATIARLQTKINQE